MNDQQALYSLEELSQQVELELQRQGVTGSGDRRVSSTPDARTIRYYTTLGLLAPPQVEKRQARYHRGHVLQLMAIKALQSEGYSLADIQSRMFGRSETELQQLITSVAGKQKPAQAMIQPVLWQELSLEAGLRLQVESGWQSANLDDTLERIRQLLSALQSKS